MSNAAAATPYVVFFDGLCRICRRGRQGIRRLRPSAPVHFVDIHDRVAVARYPQVNDADLRGQMHVIDPGGRLTGGYDALAALVPILPPLAWLGRFPTWPLVRKVGHRAYRWLAANRYRLGGQHSCHDGACQLHH